MKTVFVHPFGNPNVYNAAQALYEDDSLYQFHTCLFNPLGSRLRFCEGLPTAPIRRHASLELLRLAATKIPGGYLNGRSQWFVDRVGANLDRKASHSLSRNTDAVYGFEDYSYHCFKRSQELGIRRIYDLPIGFHSSARKLLEEEALREPGTRPFMQALQEPEQKIRRKEAEIALATHIVCASSFTCSTVPESIRNSTKVSVVPYGADCSLPAKTWDESDQRGPLKLLFVGRLDPRKGLHVLFRALDRISKHMYELTLVGRWVPGFREYLDRKYSVHYTEVGQVRHRDLHNIYTRHHAFVFPSLFEGFGLVIFEAMAAGIPVIATERTGAPDVLTPDSGFVIDAGNAETLRQSIEYLLANRHDLPERGALARTRAEHFSWPLYRRNLLTELAAHRHNSLVA
jgi:glycosyltransferase involved in cell wall biosynthesis